MPPVRSSPSPMALPQTSRLIAVTGRLRNEHFHLTTDHLLLEVDRATLNLQRAFAEGNVEVHLHHAPLGLEYVFFSRRAIYHPSDGHLHLSEWLGTRQNGRYEPFPEPRRELVLPVDGTFFMEEELPQDLRGKGPDTLCYEVLATF